MPDAANYVGYTNMFNSYYLTDPVKFLSIVMNNKDMWKILVAFSEELSVKWRGGHKY